MDKFSFLVCRYPRCLWWFLCLYPWSSRSRYGRSDVLGHNIHVSGSDAKYNPRPENIVAVVGDGNTNRFVRTVSSRIMLQRSS